MENENNEYFKYVRTDLIQVIAKGAHSILEVGCAEGATGAALKANGCAGQVTGIELDADAARLASTRLDRVIFADVEKIDFLKEALVPESFDYIICGDVLEHLRDPWYQLERLLILLKVGGKLIVSLPNIRYYGVLFPLMFNDDFTYQAAGILDRTHLRFFTKSSSEKMLKSAGLTNLKLKSLMNKRRDKLLNLLSAGLLSGLVSPQWLIVGTKPK